MPLLEAVDFRNPSRARDAIGRLRPTLSERVWAKVETLLGSVPDPDEALHHLERLRQQEPVAFDRIAASATALYYLVTVFSYSAFLSEALLRDPEWILKVAGGNNMHRALSADEYDAELTRFLPSESEGLPAAADLARFRRRQLLRILLRDALGLAALADVTEELSNLSDAIQDRAYRGIRSSLAARHGAPCFVDASGVRRECGFAVLSLGKLGGKELNYSSDIDLMFVYTANGETSGPEPVANREFYMKVANQFTSLLSTHTQDGLCYRVDLRLRPDGRLGEAAISLDGAKRYYAERARDWELQMLIKARVSAGDTELGRELLDFVEPRTYSTSLDFRSIESVSATRVRIGEKLAAKRMGREVLDIKLAPGGIRDIEFLVQCLQRLHGGREPWIRHGGTQLALFRLHSNGLLSSREYGRLSTAYQFLRHLEHRLQFHLDLQTHTLPADPEELSVLARKMPLGVGVVSSGEGLLRQVREHAEEVQEIYRQVIDSQKLRYGPAIPPPAPPAAKPSGARSSARSHRRFEHFLEKLSLTPDGRQRLETNPELAHAAADLFKHSAYFADQLIRNPEWLDELPPAPGAGDRAGMPGTAGELRRFYRRRMLRIQAESILCRVPIFETLALTSDLADAVIGAVYRSAVEAERASRGGMPATERLSVIALGRLGVREFDLASDADLVFVVQECGEDERQFWTGVARNMVSAASAYTGDGTLFTVDTRLRPYGSEGPLVQSEAAYKEYFARHAQAWEGISYMKSRAVAGDVARGTEFLNELQAVDWRRYGQGGRGREELVHMRARLESEQGPGNALKAGRGGYYDIDFALMYLRLKAAGIFYKVLNTPQRIDVIEQEGHLDRGDADFFRDAATFYRAIDHAARVSTGSSGGAIEASPSQTEVLTSLVHRWTPSHMHDRALDEKLAEIRGRTRQLFERIFGR